MDPMRVTIRRDGEAIAWDVENDGPDALWAYLLVPRLDEGRYTFDPDVAWIHAEGEDVVVRKTDVPIPAGVRIMRIPVGAVEIAPGERVSGRTVLGDPVRLHEPWTGFRGEARPLAVTMEVGWVPVRQGQEPERLAWEGRPFAYLRADREPGGQRISRSNTISWS
jgi:hypothetical protein